jgi:hypothetical protein
MRHKEMELARQQMLKKAKLGDALSLRKGIKSYVKRGVMGSNIKAKGFKK